jgi:NAD+ synthase (glutamine-hydrolysing)
MPLRLALAQINPTVGDLDGNLRLIEETIASLAPLAPDLTAFPELALTGYPPEDMLHYRPFVEETMERASRLARDHPRERLLVGMPLREGNDLYNGAALLHDGRIIHVYRKCTLPNYGVFDEKRYFRAGRNCTVYQLGPWKIAVNICEDIWVPRGVPEVQARAGAQVMVNLSSSPYFAGKGMQREALIRHRARQHGVILGYVNLVGGQDELVFDGESLVVLNDGTLLARGAKCESDLIVVDLEPLLAGNAGASSDPGFAQPPHEGLDGIEEELRPEIVQLGPLERRERSPLPGSRGLPSPLSEEEEIYRALVLGTRDYVHKNGFGEVVIGLSGGIDSALTAVIACDALGRGAVHGLTMPGPFTSDTSLAGARELAANLGISLATVPIGSLLAEYLAVLGPVLEGGTGGITEENLQARIRGNLLMACSNARGWLVLTTGNKSELAVGYCTLYGDMAGGFCLIKDVPKSLVYRLAAWRNARESGKGPIPEDTVTRPPSAELHANQKDSDTLPPYPVLDPILEARIEREEPPESLIASGFDGETVRKIYDWIDRNEYKRRQAAPGIKITPRAFGKDRRYPITNRYRPR